MKRSRRAPHRLGQDFGDPRALRDTPGSALMCVSTLNLLHLAIRAGRNYADTGTANETVAASGPAGAGTVGCAGPRRLV